MSRVDRTLVVWFCGIEGVGIFQAWVSGLDAG